MGRKHTSTNTSRNPKRSKRAKSLKLSWKLRKRNRLELDFDEILPDLPANELNKDSENNSLEHDFDEILPDLPVNELNKDSETNRVEDESNALESELTGSELGDYFFDAQIMIEKNPDWCTKKYRMQCRKEETKSNETEYGVISSDECDSIHNHQLTFEYDPGESSPITGNRIVELGFVLDWALQLQYKHSKLCTLGRIYIKKEVRKSGLVSSIIFNCTVCTREYKFDTENPNRPVSLINTGAVWGTLASGSTHTHLSELLSSMDIPTMSEAMFYELENKFGEEWKMSLWRSMEAAGVKEREHALEIGNVCEDGTPWITVYLDGSWSKRSYGTNYNALSGMIGIIGRHTGELLFVAVRNKFCSICTRAANLNEEPNQHICYKNWSASAPSMEL